jgi:ribose transport system substrate-binding protein
MTANHEGYLIKSIVSASQILGVFRFPGETLRLKEIIERSGFTKAKSFRLLYTLENCGFVERVENNRYRSVVRAPKQRRYKFGYAWPGEDYLFARDVIDSVTRVARGEGIDILLADNQYDSRVALHNADVLIREGVQLAMEFQTNEAIAPIIAAKYHEAGIPLIAIEIPHPGATFYGANNYEAGLIAGRYLARWAKLHWAAEVDEIVMMELPRAGSLPAARITGMVAGIREILRTTTTTRVITLDGDGQFGKSLEVVRKHLRRSTARHTLVGAINDPSALGALRAFEESGRVEHCAVMGQNASPEARTELRKKGSRLVGSVGYFPEKYGEDLIPLALDILQKRVVPPAVFIRHKLVDHSNVDHYYPNDALIDTIVGVGAKTAV